MDYTKAKALCDRWLPAWTGGKEAVDGLLACYTPDAFYLDPVRPGGLNGHGEMRAYFEKLLAKYPDWRWEAEEIFPTEKGFTLKWKGIIPITGQIVTLYGVDIVEAKGDKISRNEVYFDSLALRA